MKHAVTQELFSYWNALRGLRLAPERGDLDPAAIRGILGDVFILELDADGDFCFRVAGARVNALFAGELKGTVFAGAWQRTARPALADLMISVLDETVPAIAGVTAAPIGRPYLDLEMLLLPLRHAGQTHTRMLGCLAPAAMPSWLGLVPCELLNLGPMRIVRPRENIASFSKISVNSETPVRHGHLRVHQGGLESPRQ